MCGTGFLAIRLSHVIFLRAHHQAPKLLYHQILIKTDGTMSARSIIQFQSRRSGRSHAGFFHALTLRDRISAPPGSLRNSNVFSETKFMPPADTAALICLSFTNAYVASTIIIFRCGRMSPPHSKSLGLKHVIVHFRNEFTQ